MRELVTIEALEPRAAGKLERLLSTAAPARSRLERKFRALLREQGLPQLRAETATRFSLLLSSRAR